MKQWWGNKKNKKRKKRLAVAYYRHSAQNRQKNSIEIQRAKVHEFAQKNNIEIVAEYIDAGVSGLTADRPGFQAMLVHVKRSNKGKKKDLDMILCLDVSRWGRFQNTNLFNHYEAQCQENGVEVIFTSLGDLPEDKEDDDENEEEGFFDDEDAKNYYKSREQDLAKRHSKILSKKVKDGAVRVSEQGNRAGGPAPYGTVRIELDEQKNLIGMMKPKQYKSYPNNRVRLAPDDQNKTAEVIRIVFDLFVKEGHIEKQIATILNERNIPAPKGGKWNRGSIRRIIQNEQYAGSVVYNKTFSKLGKKKVLHNPRKKWIVTPNSYVPVVERDIFDKAQSKLNFTRDEMLKCIRFVIKKYGMLSHTLLLSLPNMPSPLDIIREFGSLPEAYHSLYVDVLGKARDDVRKMIEVKANEVSECEDFLVINNMFTIKIAPALPFPRGYGHQWFFRVDKDSDVDITLGVPLRDNKDPRILGYFPFLRVLTNEPLVCIAHSSSFKIRLLGYSDLRFIFDLIHWTNSTNKETNK